MDFGEMSGPRWTLRSSRVTAADHQDDREEESQSLLKSSPRSNRPWKAKREDYSDDEHLDNNGLAIPLSNKSKSPPDQCVEAEIQPGETLQSVALKYNVPLAELKRVNNLLKEAEFYALKRVKIPVKTASLLTEILPTSLDRPNENGWYISHKSTGTTASSTTVQSSTPVSETDGGSQMDPMDPPICHQLVDLGTPPTTPSDVTAPTALSKQARRANRYLRNIDKELARIKEKTENRTTPEREDGDDEAGAIEEGELRMSTMTSTGEYTTTKLLMPSKVVHSNNSSTWCSKSGLYCAFLIVISVVLILSLAYWLHMYHSQLFVSHSDESVHHNQESDDQHVQQKGD